MKEYKKNQYILIILILVSLGFIIGNFISKQSNIINYIAFTVLGFMISTEIFYISIYRKIKQVNFLENRLKLWNTITYRVKNAGETAFNEMPLGIVVFNDKLEVEWANNYSKDIFLSPLVGRNIKNIDRELTQKLEDKLNHFNVTLYSQVYSCEYLVDDNVLYLTDITEKTKVMELYKSKILALGVINLDNLTSAFGSLDAQEKSLQISNLIGILSEWADKYNISLTGYSEERYLLILNRGILDMIISDNFDILDKVREYTLKENLRVTASIGIACLDTDPITLLEEATNQLGLALNRGGNQAVIKINDETLYLGAKTESFENRSAVSTRIKAEELSDLITRSSKVIIMSHVDMDADGFGSSIAVRKLCKALGREGLIVFDSKLVDQSVANIYDSIVKEHVNFLNAFITPKEAIGEMTDDTLLIIVDCQYQNILMEERIFSKAKKVAIIDHHRRSPQAITNYAYIYTQSSASSSVELVMEMSEFFNQELIDISGIEATWMLMGVVVDTNNFIYRTTSRTFNVLAKLQGYGADMSKTQRYLREAFSDYVKKISILNNIEIYNGRYGIALCDDEIYPRSFLAKIANEIVTVNNITSAFCIGKISDNEIGISARSLDEENVQVIMERMGGGGHFNNAATQLKNTDIKSAREQLIKVLKENASEGDKFMKIILTKDVKGKGKTSDIIDIPAGYGNFLIRNGQAIEATADNIKHLEYEKTLEKQEQEKHLKDMQELKKRIESSPITIGVKVGKAGKLFGSVSTKQIADEFTSKYNIDIDKRKIISDKEIDALGTYKIPIQLHKEVMATITLYVVEKG